MTIKSPSPTTYPAFIESTKGPFRKQTEIFSLESPIIVKGTKRFDSTETGFKYQTEAKMDQETLEFFDKTLKKHPHFMALRAMLPKDAVIVLPGIDKTTIAAATDDDSTITLHASPEKIRNNMKQVIEDLFLNLVISLHIKRLAKKTQWSMMIIKR